MKQNKFTKGKKPPNPSTTSSTSFKVIPTDTFISEAKKLQKKYIHIKDDFMELQKQLKKDPTSGNDFLGKDCYKIRMPISDKNSGDRGGARVIVEVKIIDKIVYVLSVYDKSDKSDLFDKELDILIKKRIEKNG